MTIFLVKSKLSTAKKSKTTTFSRVFQIFLTIFLVKSKLNFWTKNEDFEQCDTNKTFIKVQNLIWFLQHHKLENRWQSKKFYSSTHCGKNSNFGSKIFFVINKTETQDFFNSISMQNQIQIFEQKFEFCLSV